MNAQFHTPSFGDEVVFEVDAQQPQYQQQQLQSRRMRGMDQSVDEYHSSYDESFANTTPTSHQLSSPMGIVNNSPSAAAAAAAAAATTPTTLAARKELTPNKPAPTAEPTKPLSAYALFFRDTVSAIKQQNPSCSFQELSRIVASMWEALDETNKNVYNKKHETAKNDYIKHMGIYRQQQLEQQQQNDNSDLAGNNNTLQTKPVVFTISRFNSDCNMSNLSQQQSQLLPSSPNHQQAQQCNNSSLQDQHSQMNNSMGAANGVTNTSNDPSPEQIQMLTEAGSVQKCTRENCNKRAIINPDWEDEYCSNECVVIHCRNVFNAWVQSNLDARKQ